MTTMRKWIFAAAALVALPLMVSAQGKGFGSNVTFYADANYGGASYTAQDEMSALGRETGMNDKASSLKVTGSWQICEDSRFRGRCVTVTQDVPDLKVLRMNNNISSVRPATGLGGGNGGEQGSNVTKYDNPRWEGAPLVYCGKSLANCGKPNADAYCKMIGHSGSMTSQAGGRTGARGFVAVERRYQTGGVMFASISCVGAASGGEHGGNGPGFGGGTPPSTNYANPSYQNAAIAYCGKSASNCGAPNANAFCRSKGHDTAVSHVEGSRTSASVYSPSEMSFSKGGRTFRSITCTGTSSGSGPGFGGGNDGGFQGGNGGRGF